MPDLRPSSDVGAAQAPDGTCPGAGLTAGAYRSCDILISAVGPAHYDISCGTKLRVCVVDPGVDQGSHREAPLGPSLQQTRCLVLYRGDSCPGCSSVGDGVERVDLSEAGLDYLAGYEGASVVEVTVEILSE